MDELQGKCWDALVMLDGEDVARAFLDWHGTKLLTKGFWEFLVEEGYATEEEDE